MEEKGFLAFPADEIKLTPLFLSDTASVGVPVLPKAEEVYGPVSFPPGIKDRPYVISSIVLSADGKMAFTDDPRGPVIAQANTQDPSGALADFWVLNMLRAYADACVIGAGTLQAESDCIAKVMDKELYAQRQEVLGKSCHPLNIVVSLDATDIPLSHMLFSSHLSGEVQAAIATGPAGARFLSQQGILPVEIMEAGKEAELWVNTSVPVIVTGNELPDAGDLMVFLRSKGIDILLSESPGYTAHLAKSKMLDEFFINYSMLLSGGSISPFTGVSFTPQRHPACRLISAHRHTDRFLYTRLQVEYN